MSEKLLINDIPLSELGCVLAPDSYKSVLTWAKFKSLRSNDWAEFNFAEYDLSKPTLDKRTVTLNFHANGESGYQRFINYLLQYVYSFFEFPELGVTLRMRVDSNSLNHLGKWQSFSISFIDDAPYFQVSPALSEMNFADTDYKLDGIDLARYGVTMLQDSIKSFLHIAQTKERLTIAENSIDGAIYDSNGEIRLKINSFTLKFLIRATNLSSAVRNYYCLFNVLKSPNNRNLLVIVDGGVYKTECFYSSSSVQSVHNKLASGLAGIAFDVQFTTTDKDELRFLVDDDIEYKLLTDNNEFLIS